MDVNASNNIDSADVTLTQRKQFRVTERRAAGSVDPGAPRQA